MTPNNLPVVGLQVNNIQKIKFADLSLDKNTVVVSGGNGAGKSSLCNALRLALGDKVASKLITKPITDGESKALVSVDVGKFTITRTWNEKGKSTTKIVNKDGLIYKSPAEFLKSMVGNLAFDPLEFSQMAEKDQSQVLLDITGIGEDLTELDEQRKEQYDARTIINREITQLNGQKSGYPDLNHVPDELLNSEVYMDEYKNATETIRANEILRDTYNQALSTKSKIESEIEVLNEQLDNRITFIKNLQPDFDNIEDPNLDLIQSQLKNVESSNELIRKKREYNKVVNALELKQSESNTLTGEINAIDDLKTELWQDANLPIQGLNFNENGVLFNGIPLKQCATSESLKVGCAIVISLMKLKSGDNIPVIVIKDGSLLDENSMSMLEQVAIDDGVQFWIEVVDTSGDQGIYIEDGEISKDNYKGDVTK